MRLAILPDVAPADVEDVVGSACYAQGLRYVRQHAVVATRWDPSEQVLHGTARGGHAESYTTTAHFSRRDGSTVELEHGECSCPVAYNCAHVAALALSIADSVQAPAAVPRGPRPVAWEGSLTSLLGSGPVAPSRPAGSPVAIELTLCAPTRPTPGLNSALARPKVMARLVRPAKNGGWAAGGLSWSKLASLRYSADYVTSHVRLLQELYALYRARNDRPPYGYYSSSYGEEKTIDLSAFDSSQLWPLLDQADEIGMQLVHGKKWLGPLRPYHTAALCLDVRRAETTGSLVITPVLRADGETVDALPVTFIGTEAHGLVCVDRTQDSADPGNWRIRLVKLVKSVPPPLQRMTLESQCLEIPAADQPRFRDAYYPQLRRLAEVTSSDGSFEPPAISDPTLVLSACYRGNHHLDVSWEWAYQVGDSRLRAPLREIPGEAGYRDPEAERLLLTNLDAPLDRFSPLRENPRAGLEPALATPATFTGIDTMRFTTELLPLLSDRPGVAVEISGEPADYREASDSLRIGVSAGDMAGETDWFDLGVSITVEEREVPFTDVFLALNRGESHLLLADGAYFSLEKPELQRLRGLIEEARAMQDSPTDRLKISRFQAGLWDELAELGVVTHQAKAWQRQVEGLLSMGCHGPEESPSTISAQLRPYQLEGFRWLAFLWKFQLGGILADDMGLGKTLQSLALICHAKQTDPTVSPFLIVAPTSVVSNWAAEAARFAPGLKVAPIFDTLRRRGQPLAEIIAGADVVVTSYTLFRLDFDAYAEMAWSGLIMDEAQFAKNHQSKIYQCARRLPAPFKLAITGTPMENNLMELWSLLSITAPGLFPSPTRFRDYYARPIEKRHDSELLARLRRRVKPLIKRRTKEQVIADLPAKQEQILEVELHPRHRKLYQTHLQRERQKVLGLIDDMNRNRFTILRSLTLLRQLSLHAGLIDHKHRDLPSSKLDALLEQLGDLIASGHRALIFSQFTGFLNMARKRLDAELVRYCYLDGATRNRARVLRQFKDDSIPVFLISLKAGGFGLNLTEADYCFLLDPWWNPATEAQAVDRTHRIGQTKNVMVYRLIARDTIEEKVMALKARKAELFANVMDDGNAFGASLDPDDIRELFA